MRPVPWGLALHPEEPCRGAWGLLEAAFALILSELGRGPWLGPVTPVCPSKLGPQSLGVF